eukprot:PhF_6_TR21149/c1_g3_i1/m.30439
MSYEGFYNSTFSTGPGGVGAGNASSSMLMDVGLRYGENLLQRSQVTSTFLAPIESMKPYFHVDNAYVGKKIGVLLVPFGRNFSRRKVGLDDDVARDHDQYYPPVD